MEVFQMSKLFSPLKLREVEFKNRIVMAPMCMYSADMDGNSNSWHYVHYITRAIGGVGLIIQEATAVESRGRISDNDLGIWKDEHVEGLGRIVDECKKYGAKMCIQLAHAGRKCEAIAEEIIAPSSIAFSNEYRTPKEMNIEDIKTVIEAFRKAALRADRAGYDAIEIHGAHGYLINEFLSKLTNERTDEYGGSLENRARFLKEVVIAIREVWSLEKPLIVRFSAEEYDDKGNHPEDIARVINMIKDEGVDMIDVSSGGVIPVSFPLYPGYQIEFANDINCETGLPVIGGGLITNPLMAEEIIQNNRTDMVFFGRELLRNPYWAFAGAKELDDETEWPSQYFRSKK
jgi:NADPH2 dehydrogenase